MSDNSENRVGDNMTRLEGKNNQSTDTATTNKPNTHTSFLKRERQYDPFETKEIINLGVIPHSFRVSDNVTRLQRKK